MPRRNAQGAVDGDGKVEEAVGPERRRPEERRGSAEARRRSRAATDRSAVFNSELCVVELGSRVRIEAFVNVEGRLTTFVQVDGQLAAELRVAGEA